MNPRYSTPISRKDASNYLRAYFGSVRLPAGASYIWVGGVQWVTDQPGVYLRSVCGGLEGVVIVPAAAEMEQSNVA